MTGYARAEGRVLIGEPQQGWRWSWELKSVNARGLDIRLRLPGGLDRFENSARKAIAGRLARGSVSAQLAVGPETEHDACVRINRSLLSSILALRDELGETTADIDTALRLDTLLTIRGMVADEPAEAFGGAWDQTLEAAAVAGLERALAQLQEMRTAEGEGLRDLLARHLAALDALCERLAAVAEGQPDLLRERLRAQMALLLDASPPLPEERLAQELALLSVRADIREEAERLQVHLGACRALLDIDEPVGRRLDFLCQELNREANTICSKAIDMSLTKTGLDLKSAIEQFREQVQNVE